MKTDWHEMTLGEFVTLQRGHDLPAAKQCPGEYPIMGSAGQNGTHNIAKAKGPGVTIGRSGVGSMGEVSFCPVDYWPHNTVLYVTDFHGNNERFVYYFLRQLDLKRYNSGSAQASLNRNYIYPISVRVPSSGVQERIAGILGSLDDKIELNRRINETLEAMVRRLFRSWFVDFDSVHAKAAVRRKHPQWDNARVSREALPNLAPDIAEAFPDEFEESELGPIPKGWRVDEIGNAVKVVGGGTPSTKNPDYWRGGIHPFCTPRDMAGLSFSVLLDTERKLTDAGVAKVSSGQLDAGTVILSSRAPIGYLAITTVPASVNQGIIAMVCDGEISNYYALQWAHASMDAIEANANGSTFQEISKRNFRPIPIVIPTPQVLTAFNERARGFHGLILENARESIALQETRDKLLPRLLSGELEVKNAS